MSHDISKLPRPLTACGCGDCFEFVDALAEGGPPVYPVDVCKNPEPVTIGEAGERYYAYAVAALDREWTDWLTQARGRYAQTMEADRQCREQFGDGLTTVLVSLRLSPITNGGDGQNRQWVPPLLLDDSLHVGWEKFRRKATYRLNRDGFNYEYVRVVAGTDDPNPPEGRVGATPHLHALFYVEDPEDEINRSGYFQTACEDFENAALTDTDAAKANGSVEINHGPQPVDYLPEKAADILHETETGDATSMPGNTKAAVYLGKQLPHLDALGDYQTDVSDTEAEAGRAEAGADYGQSSKTPNRSDTSGTTSGKSDGMVPFQTAAIAWSSSHDWFGRSGGLTG